MYNPDGEYNNEDAVAWGWVSLCIVLVVVAFFYAIVLSPLVNSLLNGPANDQPSTSINGIIKSGKASEQAVNSTNFGVQMFLNIPLFLLLAGLVWSANRAITVKGG